MRRWLKFSQATAVMKLQLLIVVPILCALSGCGTSPTESVGSDTGYVYKVPPQSQDGWAVLSMDTSKTEVKGLFGEIEKIQNGIYPEIHSLLIVSEGKLVLEEYFPGHNSNGAYIKFTKDVPHEVQSASKSFRSALIGIAIDKGFIEGVDARLFYFFPYHAHLITEQKNRILLHHILTMSSGLDWDEWSYAYTDSRNTLRGMYELPYAEWTNYILSRPMAYEAGSRWVYNTGSSIMLNTIIMQSISFSFTDFVRQYYSDPLECSRVPGVGNPLGGETLPRDMAKLGYLYLNDGKWKGREIVSKSWIEQSTNQYFQIGPTEGYGYQWWIRSYTTNKGTYGSFYASGNGGQYIIVIKELNLVIVFTGGNFNNDTLMSVPFAIVEDSILPAFE